MSFDIRKEVSSKEYFETLAELNQYFDDLRKQQEQEELDKFWKEYQDEGQAN